MKHFKWILFALSLLAVVLALLIFLPVISEEQSSRESAAQNAAAQSASEGAVTPQAVLPALRERLVFDLKYDKYLIETPESYEVDGELRTFQFAKMLDTLAGADEAFAEGPLTYVDNYKNQNGRAPYYHGKSVDAFGTPRSASAPGYPDPENPNEFVYIPDGTLVRVISEEKEFTRVVLVLDGKEYSVPTKYVRTESILTDLSKAIAVDRKNQNIATLEKRSYGGKMGQERKERWTVVSYSLATTGKVGKYHQPTPLGFYYAIEKRERFYYLKDGTSIVEGYAPYAVRFTAGAYTHGIATAYKYRADGSRSDPGILEYSDSIGTLPLSHKCVRNYTSHAKFIYDWYEQGKTIVVVIE